jgi:hypothetical protein
MDGADRATRDGSSVSGVTGRQFHRDSSAPNTPNRIRQRTIARIRDINRDGDVRTRDAHGRLERVRRNTPPRPPEFDSANTAFIGTR